MARVRVTESTRLRLINIRLEKLQEESGEIWSEIRRLVDERARIESPFKEGDLIENRDSKIYPKGRYRLVEVCGRDCDNSDKFFWRVKRVMKNGSLFRNETEIQSSFSGFVLIHRDEE